MKDLVVLVADKDIESSVKGLLKRPESLQIRDISFDVFVHPQRDPGCLNNSADVIGGLSSDYSYALIIFDKEGCGWENKSLDEVHEHVSQSLASWTTRVAAVTIDPEIEAWVWSDSPHVDRILGWEGRNPNLRDWLLSRGFLQNGRLKPDRPKEAMEAALRVTRIPRSSSLYGDIATNVGLNRCTDISFERFKTLLRNWFSRIPEYGS